MNYNKKRHELLQELTRLITNRDENRNNFDCNEVSMTFKQVNKFLNVTRQEREIILSDLWKSKEIILCEVPENTKSFFINDPIGISSFSNKKYLKNNNKPENKSITNNFYNNSIKGDNFGFQSSESDLKDISIKHKKTPKPKDKKHHPILTFVYKFWWTFVVPIAVGIIIILIDKGHIDISFITDKL